MVHWISAVLHTLTVAVFTINYTSCSKILVVPSVSTGSLFLVTKNMAIDLAERGHNVTLLMSNVYYAGTTDHSSGPEMSDVHILPYQSSYDMADTDVAEFTKQAVTGQVGWYSIFQAISAVTPDCDSMFSDETVMAHLKSSEFDLINACEFTPCGALLAHYLDRPFILHASTRVIPEWDAYMYNIPNNLAYTPCAGTGLTDKMSFIDRVYNSAYYVMKYVSINIILNGYGDIQQKYNITPHLSIRDMFADAELFLFCTDLALDFPRPLMPNVIYLGGSYLSRPASALDKELEDFVQSSGDDGIVIFSLGSYAVMDDGEHFRKFVMGLKKLPQKIIAKYDGDKPPAYVDTDKFKLLKWLPQNDLLGHPKTKALVYHGGMNGVYEAINHGVPVVGIPLFYDQHDNIKAITKKGMGLALDARTVTSDDLYEAVTMVINDPRYKGNAVRLSTIYKDKPMSPKDAMIYWFEYAIKHRGKHLQSQAVHLNFFQYYLIDVFAFTICVIGIFVFFIMKTCSFIGRMLCKRHKEKVN
ncbi:UDP-glucuronosyltransferase 2C1-like [Glandiceps talaboti]